ncbi:hypothetical protein [Aeromonas veronii]|uniref:hypothetical protein n=1 Tax=Aeromonas veronii TaxID=654 RepID=UPI0018EED3B2|nr:hypothetical protein [Aeromonas veronii]
MCAMASYLPESQIITLSNDILAFHDPENPIGFTNPIQFGVFFHEWIHYLHNVSTISGLSLFSIQVTLWSNFRWTMNEDKLSGGSQELSEEHIINNKNMFTYIRHGRINNNAMIPSNIQPDNVEIIFFELLEKEIKNDQVTKPSTIKCDMTWNGKIFTLYIGILEMLESAAYMLESKLVSTMGETPISARFSPYHLVSTLASKIAPSLSNEDIICCIITALQYNDPPELLLSILKDLESQPVDERQLFLKSHAKKLLQIQEDAVDETIRKIREMFPVHEPMGDVVKLTLDRIENNISFRKTDPFIELSIIDITSKEICQIDEFIIQFGGCTIIQERHGEDDQIERDIMYDLNNNDFDDFKSFGWKMMRAAFHFTMLHFDQHGKIKSTKELPESKYRKCPFYTSCNYKQRHDSGHICAQTPWETIKNNDCKCYYAAAVKATNPPPNSLE